jgi:hypothetical protein
VREKLEGGLGLFVNKISLPICVLEMCAKCVFFDMDDLLFELEVKYSFCLWTRIFELNGFLAAL